MKRLKFGSNATERFEQGCKPPSDSKAHACLPPPNATRPPLCINYFPSTGIECPTPTTSRGRFWLTVSVPGLWSELQNQAAEEHSGGKGSWSMAARKLIAKGGTRRKITSWPDPCPHSTHGCELLTVFTPWGVSHPMFQAPSRNPTLLNTWAFWGNVVLKQKIMSNRLIR